MAHFFIDIHMFKRSMKHTSVSCYIVMIEHVIILLYSLTCNRLLILICSDIEVNVRKKRNEHNKLSFKLLSSIYKIRREKLVLLPL